MTRYSVNATLTVPAWIEVESDSPEQAREDAKCYSAHDYDYDLHSATVECNVTPDVEVVAS